jgi:hypothetical protein
MSPDSVGIVTFDSLVTTSGTTCQVYFGGVNIPIYALSTDSNYVFDYWQLPDSTSINKSFSTASTLINLGSSGDVIAHFKLNDGTGISKYKYSNKGGIIIAPNPNNGSFIISLMGLSTNPKRIQLINSQGTLVKNFITNSSSVEVTGYGLANGLYSVLVSSNTNTFVSKVLIQH